MHSFQLQGVWGPPEPEIPLKANMALSLSRVAENRGSGGGMPGERGGVADKKVCFDVKLIKNCGL